MGIVKYFPLWLRNLINAHELARVIKFNRLSTSIGLDIMLNDRLNLPEAFFPNSCYVKIFDRKPHHL